MKRLRAKIFHFCKKFLILHNSNNEIYQNKRNLIFYPRTPPSRLNPPRTSYVKAPLQPIESNDRFQLVCYDLAGPFLPVTVRGNSYALIIVDHFSHWPEFVALPDITAPSIASALFDNWCCRYGIPERFHSDGARNVHGEVM